jgi:hypothetical protein
MRNISKLCKPGLPPFAVALFAITVITIMAKNVAATLWAAPDP